MTNEAHLIYRSQLLLFGLLIKCPFRRSETDCPFREFQCDQSLEQKFHYLDTLNEERVGKMIAHHEQCYRRRSEDCFYQKTINRGGEKNGAGYELNRAELDEGHELLKNETV